MTKVAIWIECIISENISVLWKWARLKSGRREMDEGQEMSINEKRELNQGGGTGLKTSELPTPPAWLP